MRQKLKNEELERLSVDAFKSAQKQGVVLVLDNVRSLNNVGSAFRTADAFLIEGIYLCGLTGTPPNKEIEKTALGATETVSWKHFPSTLEALNELKNQGFTVYAIEQAQNSKTLGSFKKPDGKIALVFGNEIYGVEQEIIDASDAVVEIPQFGTKHSLNISVSIGIVLWELLKGEF